MKFRICTPLPAGGTCARDFTSAYVVLIAALNNPCVFEAETLKIDRLCC
jgi:hypothetical protein